MERRGTGRTAVGQERGEGREGERERERERERASWRVRGGENKRAQGELITQKYITCNGRAGISKNKSCRRYRTRAGH